MGCSNVVLFIYVALQPYPSCIKNFYTFNLKGKHHIPQFTRNISKYSIYVTLLSSFSQHLFHTGERQLPQNCSVWIMLAALESACLFKGTPHYMGSTDIDLSIILRSFKAFLSFVNILVSTQSSLKSLGHCLI